MGAWVERDEALRRAPVDGGLPEAGTTRLARANRLTRLGALATERASRGLIPIPSDRMAIVGATTLASLRTNARYERRRMETGRAAPRDFALTAPNAWVGEIAATNDTLGASTCLVGPDAGVQAIATASRWLASRFCDRVVVVAAESLPEDRSILVPQEDLVAEGSAAIVLEAASLCAYASITVGWGGPTVEGRPMSSLETIAKTWLHACEGRGFRAGDGRAGFHIELTPAIGMGASG
jgi:hypothetical protein